MNAAAGIWLLIAIGQPNQQGVDNALVIDKSYPSLAACSYDAGSLSEKTNGGNGSNIVCAFIPKVSQ